MSKKTTIKTAAELNTDSREIVKAFKDQGKALHRHLMDIARHVMAHGNVTPASRLIKLLEDVKGNESRSIIRVDAVDQWLKMFAACKPDKETGAYGLNKSMRNAVNKSAEDYAEHMTTANKAENHWNRLTTAKPVSFSFDLEKAIKQAIERAETAEEKARERANGDAEQEKKNLDAIKVSPELLEAAKKLVSLA